MKKTVKRIFALFMSLLLLPSAFAGVTSFTAAAEDAAEVFPIIELNLEKDFVPGQLMIVLREPYLGNNLAEVLPEISIASYDDMYGNIIEELCEENVTDVMLDGMGTMFTVTLTEETEEAVIDALDKLSDNSNLLSASPNYLSETTATTPNDTYYSTEQWALPKIKAPEVWDEITDSTVSIAVLDSGFYTAHTDLDDVLNLDLAYNSFNGTMGDVEDTINTGLNGHGTHVAGIIAAEGNNNDGVSGVVWNAEIIPIKIGANSNAVSTDVSRIKGILYALALDIKVANLSYDISGSSYALQHVLGAFSRNNGIIVIAAGNTGTNLDELEPQERLFYQMVSANSGVIMVGASNENDEMWASSNYGSNIVDIFAPGVNIYSTHKRNSPNGRYRNESGTSMAAPFVTGAVALLMSKYPNLSAQTIKNTIIENADYVPALAGKCVANGRLNIKAAMDALEGVTDSSPVYSEYNVLVSASITNGTVTPSPNTASSSMFVFLTVDPDTGYWLKPNTLTYNGYIIADTNKANPLDNNNGMLYTNYYYFQMPNSSVTINAVFYMIGDIDLDGSVTVSDSLAVLRHVSGAAPLTGDALIAADVDGDGEVTQTDSQIILSYAAGEITLFPIEA